MNYREAYDFGKKELMAAAITDADPDARLLLEYICETTRNDLYSQPDKILSVEEQESYVNLIQQRKNHKPLQYITGTQSFMGLDFYVNQNVLIPRLDTEVLVEEALKHLHDGMRILDICTGSGCILISLLHYSNRCNGVGADISGAALEVAKKNAEQFNCDALFIESDLLKNVQGKFDIVVSNPPYIRTEEIEKLMPEVKTHEPRIALDGDKDGLLFYQRILADIGEHMYIGSYLLFEIGFDQGQDVCKLMEENSFTDVCIIKDLTGLDRVVLGVYK